VPTSRVPRNALWLAHEGTHPPLQEGRTDSVEIPAGLLGELHTLRGILDALGQTQEASADFAERVADLLGEEHAG
jgi:hypothetical protein